MDYADALERLRTYYEVKIGDDGSAISQAFQVALNVLAEQILMEDDGR